MPEDPEFRSLEWNSFPASLFGFRTSPLMGPLGRFPCTVVNGGHDATREMHPSTSGFEATHSFYLEIGTSASA